MKLIWKTLPGLSGLLLLLVAYIHFAPPPTFDLPLSEDETIISTDSAALSLGEYIIYGPAHCPLPQ